MRIWAGAIGGLLVAVFVLGGGASGAEAHAYLQRSQPSAGTVVDRPPVEVLLWFTEDIEIDYSSSYVIDADGTRWEEPNEGAFHVQTDPKNPGLILKPRMPNGVYTVIWDVLSAVDGHRTKGSFAFSVGEQFTVAPPVNPGSIVDTSTPPKSLEVSVRWLNFAAIALLIGAAAFPFLIIPAALDGLPEDSRAERRASRAVRYTALLAAVALLAGSALMLWVQSWSALGDATSLDAMYDVLDGTRFGDIWVFRLALGVGAVVCAAVLLWRREPPWNRSILAGSNNTWLLLAGVALFVPLTTSLNSHAAAGSPSELETVVDWVHLVAAGLWAGLIVQLLLVLLVALPFIQERARFVGPLVRRFSMVALPAVGVIIATGVVQSIQRLGAVSDLFDSDYGNALLVKVILLSSVIVFAAANLLIIGPRLLRLARDRAADLGASLWEFRLRGTVIAEVALAAGILVATAVLTTNSPPAGLAETFVSGDIPPPPQNLPEDTVEDMNIIIWASPGTPGANEINVLLRDINGDAREIQRVILRISYKEDDLGQAEIDAQPTHPPTHWTANTTQMSLAGEWEVEIIVRREGLFDVRTTLPIQIGA